MLCPAPEECPVWIPVDDSVDLDRVQLYKLNFLSLSTLYESYLPGERLFYASQANSTQSPQPGECWNTPDNLNNNAQSQPGCRLAYNNINTVAVFIEETLNPLIRDSPLTSYIASINVNLPNIGSNIWSNAGWNVDREQAVFGQYRQNGTLHSLAGILDIVAHEFCHGLISNILIIDERQRGFEYECESGALEESLCDILAILVSNSNNPDIGSWNWEIGQGLGEQGGALRNLSNPTLPKPSQPDHMNNYKRLNPGERPCDTNDRGYVHINSGIHNKAFYNLVNSRYENNNYFFNQDFSIELFLRYLLQLTVVRSKRDSDFADSRRAMLEVAEILVENDTMRDIKIDGIRQAFEQVGIVG